MSSDITPNGTTGTLTERCYVDPSADFSYADMNVLANNSAYLCQRHETMLTAYHYMRVARSPSAIYYQSSFVQSYTRMAAGSFVIGFGIQYNAYGSYSGNDFTGTLTVDGTVLCTFGSGGTTGLVAWSFTGATRWILTQVRIVPGNTDQFFANDYWVGYRRVVTT